VTVTGTSPPVGGGSPGTVANNPCRISPPIRQPTADHPPFSQVLPPMRRVNLPLVMALALLLVGGAAGLFWLRKFQMRRNADGMAQQAKLQIDKGNDEEAIKLLARYVAIRPDDSVRQREYAELLLRHVDAGKADARTVGVTLAALEVALRRNTEDDDMREKLATLLARTGDADSACNHLAIIRERRTSGESNDDTIRIDLLFAALASRTGRLDDAEKVLASLTGFDQRTKTFDPAVTPAPGHPEAFAGLAEIVEKHRRDSKGAERIVQQMIKVAPDDVAAWKTMAAWRMAHRQNAEAEQAVARASALDPDDQGVALLELQLAMVSNRFDRAEELLAGPLKDAPSTEQTVGARAFLARQKGDIDGWLGILRDGLAANPASPMFRIELLLGLAEAKRIDDLRPLVNESRPILGKEAPAVLWAEAAVAMSEQRWLEALQLWERVRPQVATDESMTRRVDMALANCYSALGQRDQANDARKRAFASAPESGAARFAEMISLEQASRWQEALALAEELAAQLPGEKLAANPSVWKPLCRLRIRDQIGRDPARQDWSKVDALLDAIAAKPDQDPIEIERMKIDVLAAKQKIDEALAASESIVATQPDDASLFAQNIVLLVAAGRVADAQAKLADAKNSLRDTAEVLEAESRLAATAPASEAQAWLTDLEERMGRVTGPAADRCARQLIAIHVGRGNVGDAERIAESLLIRHPTDLAVRQVVLELAAERDAIDAVKRQTAELVRVAGPTSATARLATAVSRIVAIRVNRQALQTDDTPTAALAPEDLASLEVARGLLAQAGEERARWSEVPRMLAAIAEIQGDSSGAIGHLRKAIEFGETLPFARRRLAILLTAAGRLDEAAPIIASLGDAGGPTIDRIRAQILASAGRTDQALSIAASLTPEDCRDPQQLVWYARLLASCGRSEEAEKVCRRATEAAPDNANAWLMLVRLQSSLGGSDRATETTRLALETLRGTSREQFELAADDAIGNPEATERVCREAVENAPEDLVAARRLVELLLRRKRPAEAREQLRRLVSLESAKGTPTLAWARRALATDLAASARYADLQEAIGILASNVDEQGLQYLDDIALSISFLIGRNDPTSWRQAQSLFEKLAKRRPLTVDERISQARIQSLVGNRTKARDDLAAIAASADTSTAVVSTMIELLITERDFGEARTWLRRLQAASPDLLTTVRLEALIALAEGDRDQAARVVRKLFGDEPFNAETAPRLLAASQIAAEIGSPEAADGVLEAYAKMSPDGVVLLASSLGRQHRTPEAIEMLGTVRSQVSLTKFLEALALILRHAETATDPAIDDLVTGWLEAARRENPGSTEVLLQTTIAKESLGRTAEAEKDYRQLLATEDLGSVQAGIVAANLAWILARPDTADQASEYVERAIRELGPLPDVLDTRALIRLAKGQTILALEDMNDAVLTPSPLKLLHLATIQAKMSDLNAARTSFTRSKALGLGRERLTPDDSQRLEQVESFLATADGKS